MTEHYVNPKVEEFFSKPRQWQAEFERLRTILLDSPLTEDFKWGWPCYAFQKRNIVLMHGFKEYSALLIFKGALLKDPQGILIQQTENVQAGRQIRFRSVQEIDELEPVIKAYINEAIEVEKSGLKIEYKKTTEFSKSEEFQKKLEEDQALKTAFEGLTPGRQREYYLYFSAPKQAKTREARVEKCIPQILAGKGMYDQYK